MTLLGMSDPIEPVLVYTGIGKTELVPRPNEPLNTEVTQRTRDQGGMAFHAHFLFWPGYGSAVGGALNLLDGLEWTSTDIVNNKRWTRQGLSIPGYEIRPTGADSGKLYYRMLNCGVRLPSSAAPTKCQRHDPSALFRDLRQSRPLDTLRISQCGPTRRYLCHQWPTTHVHCQ